MKFVFLIAIVLMFIVHAESEIVRTEEMSLYPPIYKNIGYNVFLIKKQNEELNELYKKIDKIKRENMLMELQANHILLSIKNLPLVEILGLQIDSLELQGEQVLGELLQEFKFLEKKEVDYVQSK